VVMSYTAKSRTSVLEPLACSAGKQACALIIVTSYLLYSEKLLLLPTTTTMARTKQTAEVVLER
jgi:hypothetical protein